MSERTEVSPARDTDGHGFDRFMSWILYALHLSFGAFSVVAIPIAIMVKTRKGRRSWTWVLAAMVAVAALTVLFVVLMTR